MGRATLALAAAMALAQGCTRAPEPSGPVPLAVLPAQGAGVEPLAVEIVGRDFDAWVKTAFADPSGDRLDAAFAARLEPCAGGAAVTLGDVVLTERKTLRATVPAGLAPGLHRLVVTDPRGRSGTLEQAFRVVTSAERVAAFRVEVLEAARAGVPFAVSLAAVDAQGGIVDGFTAAVTLSSLAGAVSPTSLGPFVRGRYQGWVVLAGPATAERLQATDGAGHTGSSAPFDVVAGPPMTVVFPDPPVAATVGGCSPPVAVELRDALGHPSPAEADVPAQLHSAPPGLAFFTDAACTSAAAGWRIPAGATRATFHFRAAAAGPVTVRALPSSLPSAAQVETVSP